MSQAKFEGKRNKQELKQEKLQQRLESQTAKLVAQMEKYQVRMPKPNAEVEALAKELQNMQENGFGDLFTSRNRVKAIRREFQGKRKKAQGARQEEKKAEKEARQHAKEEKRRLLEEARVEKLPETAQELKGSKTLHVFVDGWNIMGCFGGRNRPKGRLVQYLQLFVHRTRGQDAMVPTKKDANRLVKMSGLRLPYDVAVHLYFDGNGKHGKEGDITVDYSGKNVIVDDVWVDMFTKSRESADRNASVLAVTCDRELTLRLQAVGVRVMKSGQFFKGYLVPGEGEVAMNDSSDTESDGNEGEGEEAEEKEEHNDEDKDI